MSATPSPSPIPQPRNPQLQALVDEVRSGGARRAANVDNLDVIDTPRMLDTIDEFLTVGAQAIASLTAVDSVLQDARSRSCRVHVAVWRPHAEGYIGKVSNGRWYSIVRAQIRGMLSDLAIRQYNGDWRLASGDLSTFFEDIIEKRTTNAADRGLDEFRQTARKKTTRFFLLALEFVDVKGGADARFQADTGMPADDPAALPSMPADVRALLELAQQADRVQRNDQLAEESAELTALRERNDQLADELGELRSMMARLLQQQEQAVQQTQPKKRSSRSRKTATKKVAPPPSDTDAIDDTLDALSVLRSQDEA